MFWLNENSACLSQNVLEPLCLQVAYKDDEPYMVFGTPGGISKINGHYIFFYVMYILV